MSHLDDIDIRRTTEPAAAAPVPPRQTGTWWAIGGLLAAALAAVYVLLIWNRDALPGDTADRTAVTATTVEARPPQGEAIAVPPLDETDSLVRQLVAALSSHPRIAAWLATDDLIRGFTVVVDTIAAGATPAAQLGVLKPAGAFQVTGSDGQAVIDPSSYARYDALADAFASLDPAGAAGVYRTLEPRIAEAYRERFAGAPFDARLERAIVLLLETPSPPREMAVAPAGIGYAYADPGLEALSPAQKHLVRMGPRNAAIVKARLREIAVAVGISPDRLPPQR